VAESGVAHAYAAFVIPTREPTVSVRSKGIEDPDLVGTEGSDLVGRNRGVLKHGSDHWSAEQAK
jgi:hypothetical protein